MVRGVSCMPLASLAATTSATRWDARNVGFAGLAVHDQKMRLRGDVLAWSSGEFAAYDGIRGPGWGEGCYCCFFAGSTGSRVEGEKNWYTRNSQRTLTTNSVVRVWIFKQYAFGISSFVQ